MPASPRLIFFTLLFVLFLAGTTEAKKPETGFLDRAVSVQGVIYKYQVFVPEDWTADKKWPVILFLHGAGERGDDGLIQTDVGLGQAIRLDRRRFPAIVVMPQCRKDGWWPESPMDDVAMKALDLSQEEFHGDPQRIYLTGLSMGGYGTWHLAEKYPEKFAAIVPICGGIESVRHGGDPSTADMKPYNDAAKKVGSKTPVWIFHGGDDDTVPVTESQRMAEAMKALGGEVHYTEYPGVGHDSWDKAYAEPELIPWILSKSLMDRKAK
ncbi:MAG: prolyl oligopeptidase family serine peptidase [Candidatus Acidiferrum sp.]